LLKTGDQWHDVSGKPIVVSNNAKWLIELGLRGKGIMMAPRWSANPYLQTGELVALLDESDLSVSQNQELAIYLLYQKPRYLVPKVKAFVDFLTERLMSPDGNGI
jgi:DNA-binding transcriptional LysR family regulator